MSEEKCRFYNTGYCKYQEKCRYLHPKEICSRKCNKNKCNKRHPKTCRYGEQCKRTDSCAYKHSVHSKEAQSISEIEELKKEIEKLKEENKEILEKISDLKREIENKDKTIESLGEELKEKQEQTPKNQEEKEVEAETQTDVKDNKLMGFVKDIIRCKFCKEEMRNDSQLFRSHLRKYHKGWRKASSDSKEPPVLNTNT